ALRCPPCPALFPYTPLFRSSLPRAGIVHRLDKDTSGLMVVALTLRAHMDLVAQLQERSVSRRYDAVVQGVLTAGGTVHAPIGRRSEEHTSELQSRENLVCRL